MENLTNFQFTWANFLIAVLTLSALWFAFQFLKDFLNKTHFKYQEMIKILIQYIFLVYEPMVLLTLGSIFVLINPIFHGLIIGLIFVVSFNGIKNYASGRIIQFDNSNGRKSNQCPTFSRHYFQNGMLRVAN